MVEYYGWITLAETPVDIDTGGLDAIVKEVRRALDLITHSNNVVGIKVINGSPVVWLLGCPNHWSPDADDALALYEFIAARARLVRPALCFRYGPTFQRLSGLAARSWEARGVRGPPPVAPHPDD
jgi:hypothetical protein